MGQAPGASTPSPPAGDSRQGARIRLGREVTILASLLVFTTLLVIGFSVRWPALLLVALGVPWAITLGGYVIAPLAAGWFARALGQFPSARATARSASSSSASQSPGTGPLDRRALPEGSDGLGLRLVPQPQPPDGPNPGLVANRVDWATLVAGVADRLEGVLGPGYSAHADGLALVLRCGGMVRRVNLGWLLHQSSLGGGERAIRVAVKLLDEAQMFAMRVTGAQWPARSGEAVHSAGGLARPHAWLEDGELRMCWADAWGVVLALRPLPLDEMRDWRRAL